MVSHGHFAWYELITPDIEAAKVFYTKVMGWGALDVSAPGRAYILFTVGHTPVCGLMHLPETARETGGKPCWVGYVSVNNVDATSERIERLGGVVRVPPTDIPDIGRFAVFADPQLATLALLTSLSRDHEKPEMRAPGRVSWHELIAADWEQALVFYSEIFGWQKGSFDQGVTGTYQLFSADGQTVGGMFTKPPTMPAPFWLYYFNIEDDIDAAMKRVMAGGGQILEGAVEVPGGGWIARCTDPQGAVFAIEGKRSRHAVGYFERVTPQGASNPRGCRWSW